MKAKSKRSERYSTKEDSAALNSMISTLVEEVGSIKMELSNMRNGKTRENNNGDSRDESTSIYKFSDTNEELTRIIDQQSEQIKLLKKENLELRTSKSCLPRDAETTSSIDPDMKYLAVLEIQYSRLRNFIIETFGLSSNFELSTTKKSLSGFSELDIDHPELYNRPIQSLSSKSLMNSDMLSRQNQCISFDSQNSSLKYRSISNEDNRQQASRLLIDCSSELTKVNSKQRRGLAVIVHDYWKEIYDIPPSLNYTLGSDPWTRLLKDWSQGSSKKYAYMSKWLEHVLSGGDVSSETYPSGVELQSVTPMMLDGFLQLVVPKLLERPDINVHVHTKEYIGTSLRITLTPN